MIPDDTPTPIKATALEFLALAQRQHESSKQLRPYYAKLAYKHGLTHREIGEAYGITEAAVRAMIKRSAK